MGIVCILQCPLPEFCRDKGIEIIALPHILQSLNIESFKEELVKSCKMSENSNIPMLNLQNPNLLLYLKTTDSINFQSIAKNAFRVCGLFPLDSNAVLYNKFDKINFEQKSNDDEESANNVSNEIKESQKYLVFFFRKKSVNDSLSKICTIIG